jgi:S1-C subfamily serine protease
MTLAEGDEHPRVEAVLEHGPAGTAGLKEGDVVTKVNGSTVTNVADVLRVARALAPGKRIKLDVRRGGEAREITVTIGEGI